MKVKVTSLEIIEAEKLTKLEQKEIEDRYCDISKLVHKELRRSIHNGLAILERNSFSEGYFVYGINQKYNIHRSNGNNPFLIRPVYPATTNPEIVTDNSSTKIPAINNGVKEHTDDEISKPHPAPPLKLQLDIPVHRSVIVPEPKKVQHGESYPEPETQNLQHQDNNPSARFQDNTTTPNRSGQNGIRSQGGRMRRKFCGIV